MVTSRPQVELPALEGGEPVRGKFLSFSQPRLSAEEIGSVVATLESGWLTTAGKAREFEKAFCKYTGTSHAVALNSCTAGLFLSLKVLGVGPGDEVITPSLTFAAGVNMIEHVGAKPVFADIDPVTWCVGPSEVVKKVTKRTKAIMPVHTYGRPCDISSLREICDEAGLGLIQDCAHAIESEYGGRNVASWGDLACYSFYATKNLTTGEGGMVATDNEEWADRLRVLALHGLDRNAYDRYSEGGKAGYDIKEPGYKFNMPDITAALGVEGLKKIEPRHRRRAEIWARYTEELSALPGLTLPAEPDLGTRHGMHLYVCVIDPEKAGLDRDTMIEALTRENIGTGIHYTPVHSFTYYQEKYGIPDTDLPNTTTVGMNTFSLPFTPFLEDNDVSDVIRAVRKIFLHYSR